MPQYVTTRATFREFIEKGSAWEKDVKTELAGIDQVSNQTCKRWALDPNGDGALREFVSRYGTVAGSAVSIEDRALNQLTQKLDAWWALETKELAPVHLTFDEFPCGRAFLRTKKHIQENVAAVKKGIQQIRDHCPKAADDVIAKAAASRASQGVSPKGGLGAPARVPASTGKGSASSITGVDDDAAKRAKAKP